MQTKQLATAAVLAAAILSPGTAMTQTSANASLSPADERALLRGKRGQAIQLPGADFTNLPMVPVQKTAGGPQYVFSDDPEYFRVPEGIGMSEKVKPGVVRIYVYHVNGTTGTLKKISTVIENLGKEPLKVRFLKYASTGPSNDYFKVGKGGLVQYFESKPERKWREIPVGAAEPLDLRMDAARVKFDELVHGFYEIEITQPARLSTVMCDPDVPAGEAARRNQVQPPKKKGEGAGRGSFAPSDYDVTTKADAVVDTADGAKHIIVADGKTDPWIRGTDGSRNSATELKGNYGVIYRIKFKLKSSDGRGMAVVMWNPHSEAMWCGGMAAAVKVTGGQFPGGIVEVPSDKMHIKGKPEHVLVQRFDPPAKGRTRTIEIVYSPPGASCLPVPIVLVPFTPAK